MPRWMPRALKRGIWWLGDRLVIDPIVGPALNPIRAEMGLVPITHALDAWWHCPRLAIGLFPAWYAPPPADWPPQVRLVGFPLYDQRGDADLSPRLQAFLAAGDAPIAFTPGSAMAHGDRFFQAAAEACQHMGRRGILLTLHHRQVPATLPPDVIHLDYAPF